MTEGWRRMDIGVVLAANNINFWHKHLLQNLTNPFNIEYIVDRTEVILIRHRRESYESCMILIRFSFGCLF